MENCDICLLEKSNRKEAEYDAKTKKGPWAFMCKECFKKHGQGLGLGKGRVLMVVE